MESFCNNPKCQMTKMGIYHKNSDHLKFSSQMEIESLVEKNSNISTKILGLFGISLGITLFSYLSLGLAGFGQPVPAIIFGGVAILFTACFFGYLFEIKVVLSKAIKKIIFLISGLVLGIVVIFYLITTAEVDIENLVTIIAVGGWIIFEIWGNMD